MRWVRSADGHSVPGKHLAGLVRPGLPARSNMLLPRPPMADVPSVGALPRPVETGLMSKTGFTMTPIVQVAQLSLRCSIQCCLGRNPTSRRKLKGDEEGKRNWQSGSPALFSREKKGRRAKFFV